MKQKFLSSCALLAVAILALGASFMHAADETTKAIAVLSPTEGNNVAGTVTFTGGSDGVKVVADLTGLKAGQHGFHIHEFGDCSSKDGKSAGGHYNPMHHEHAGPDASDRHMGDLGNIEADASGKAHLEHTDKMLKLAGDNSIIGYAVIVHEKADDMKTQPTGDAGGRVACGVIGVAKP
ncbi:MAG TPA: superoxide dismutase family protein [Chthoniobacterales bacterium]|nr:superoxide dismutase family protein [Chthoniobacterales bacterium]